MSKLPDPPRKRPMFAPAKPPAVKKTPRKAAAPARTAKAPQPPAARRNQANFVGLRLSDDLVAKIDAYAAGWEPPKTRSEAIRALIQRGMPKQIMEDSK